MISALLVLALAAQTPAAGAVPPATTATAATATAATATAATAATAAAIVPAKLKVLVLDVQSADLTDNERTTLTNLAAAQLSEDTRLEVLSGEDIKQLVKLQGQAQDIGVEGNCTDACMAELAGALGAGVVVATQAGKLGETLVLSLIVFDAAKAKTVSRKSVQATSLGELPAKLGPALAALVQPLLPAVAVVSEVTTPTPRTSTTPTQMSTRLRELYDVEAMEVCFEAENRAAWWFCNKKQAFTENGFAREYRTLTGNTDLERADVDRGPGAGLAIGMFALGAVGASGAGFALLCGPAEACGDGPNEFLFGPEDDADASPFIVLAALGSVAAVVGTTLGITFSAAQNDGMLQEHVLTEGEGRGAIDRYNASLREKLARDLGE